MNLYRVHWDAFPEPTVVQAGGSPDRRQTYVAAKSFDAAVEVLRQACMGAPRIASVDVVARSEDGSLFVAPRVFEPRP